VKVAILLEVDLVDAFGYLALYFGIWQMMTLDQPGIDRRRVVLKVAARTSKCSLEFQRNVTFSEGRRWLAG